MLRNVPVIVMILASVPVVWAGPPFVTDDPEPVDHRHWEVYFASQLAHDADGWSGTSPHVEINYGMVTNLQLHLIAPIAFVAPNHGSKKFGYGDTELGAKYRFIQETTWCPQVGVFPLLEVPTGDRERGLGIGHVQSFFPVWLQKSWGAENRQWTSYGGGGYWINPGEGNRDWWFVGWLLQRQITGKLTIGTEVFHETAQQQGGDSDTWVKPGAMFDLNETVHLLLSAGHTVQRQGQFQAYVAIQPTFRPGK